MHRKSSIGMLLAIALATSCQVRDSSSGSGVLPGVDSVVFAKRAYLRTDGEQDVAGGAGQVVDYLRYVPGGGVFTLTPPAPDGKLRELTAGFQGVDVGGLDLSFDGKEIVFSMRHAADDGHYHLYKARVDGSERVKQLTFGAYDDVRPIYVPGGRIAFVTRQPYTEMGQRADEYNHGREVTQMATISSESGDADRRLCAQNLSHSADPFLLRDGTVAFSRWEHLGPINDLKLFHMNPDCTGVVPLAGQHNKPFNSFVQAREASEGVLVGIATSREGTIQAGAIMQVDLHAQGGVLDEQAANFKSLTPDVPTDRAGFVPSGVGRYRSPFVMGDGRFLVSWADGDVNERLELAKTAPKFGLYMLDTKDGSRVRVYDDPSTWDLYAQPIRAREEPPVLASRVDVSDGAPASALGQKAAVLGSIDIADTSLDEQVQGGQFTTPVSLHDALLQAEKVRIIEGFSSEIGAVRDFGLTMHEGAAILGEAEIQKDRSWEALVVPYLPYHMQAIDRFGLAIRNELLWVQAMPGENRTCGGCHESRARAAMPTQGATLAQQLPDAQKDFSTRLIADRVELPWYGAVAGPNVQDVFDAKCIECHDGGSKDPYAGRSYTVQIPPMMGSTTMLMYQIPYLKLTKDPVDTYYERTTVSYPASYVSLLYPSAMMGDAMASGDVPNPPWVIPGSARQSRLIAKINATPIGDRAGKEWAFSGKPHPEDVGGPALTPEERLTLIRMADLGGQYYSRRNTDDAQAWLMKGK